MAVTTQLVPSTKDTIMPLLAASAVAAAGQCTGQAEGMAIGNACGRRWYQTTWDGNYGVGEQMSAMTVFQSNLIGSVALPKTSVTGGNSTSDPDAGSGSLTDNGDPYITDPVYTMTIGTGDKAGAAILTILSSVMIVAFCGFIVI